MSPLHYINPTEHAFGEKHEKRLLEEDSKLAVAAFCMLLAMSLALTVFSIRYGRVSETAKFAICIFGSIVGILLAVWKTDDEKVFLVTRHLARAELSIVFLYLSVSQVLAESERLDGVVMFFAYCLLAACVLHINPVFFSLEVILFFAITFQPTLRCFGYSVTSMFFVACFFAVTIFVAFYRNREVKQELLEVEGHKSKQKDLEKRLKKKNSQMLTVIKREVEMQKTIIYSIANLIESRDTDTGTHIKSTTFYVGIILNNLKKKKGYSSVLSKNFVEICTQAALMHDIGKITVPDSILKAPRRLTEKEFEVMKTHTTEGARIVETIYDGVESKSFVACASNIARYHHERWDGNGYPEKLKGADIPLEARIMSVADVFDALVSERCYKDSFPMEEAFREIEKNSGTQFDPDIVEAFLESKKEIEQILVEGNFEKINETIA